MYSLTKQYSTHSLRTKSFTEKYEIYVHGKEITFKCRCFYIFLNILLNSMQQKERQERQEERERENEEGQFNNFV